MTTDTTSGGPGELGADLARQALAAARRAAKDRPRQPVKKRRRVTVRREDGRDPAPLNAAVRGLVATHGWEMSSAGGSVMDRWPEIAPEMAQAGTVVPVAFDAERQVLALRPASPAFATQLRLFGPQLIARINEAMGGEVVRELRVLAPGNTSISRLAVPAPARSGEEELESEMPRRTKTREEAHPGYHRAREILLTGADCRPGPADRPEREEKRARYFAGVYTRAPEEELQSDPDAEAAARRAYEDEQIRRRALARARRDRTERAQAAGRVFGTTA